MPVKKKPKRVEPKTLTPEEAGKEVLDHLQFVRREPRAKCDVSSHELVTVVKDSLTESLESVYPGMKDAMFLADEMSRDVLRNLRYGTPTPTLYKPVSIREADIDPPLCKECE
jgi:hypothetical protein